MCDINGHTVPAVVDTGSEITVMSASCARRCKIYNLLDTKFAAKVSGVGTGEIIGAVQDQSFKIGKLRFGSKLSILRDSRRDLIIGLDILDRFQSEIDLSQRSVKMKVRGTTVKVPLVGDLRTSQTFPVLPSASVAPAKLATPAAPITVQELSGGFYDEDNFEDDYDLYDDVVSMEGV
eukprot:gene12975-14969_t